MWVGATLLIVLAAGVTAIVVFVPTRDDGLRWFNEEFWITLVINFISVAASIGLTVYISLYILRRQIAHDEQRSLLDRMDRSAELAVQSEKERRLRHSDGLQPRLEEFGAALAKASAPGSQNRLGTEDRVRRACQAVEGHDVRYAGDGEFYAAIMYLVDLSRQWIGLRKEVATRDVDALWQQWEEPGTALANHALMLATSVPEWLDSGDFYESPNLGAAVAKLDQLSAQLPGV